jgi:hypothetical protein
VHSPAIVRRIDAALAAMEGQGVKPRAIHLVQADYEGLAQHCTKKWQAETGSTATLWPHSFCDIPLVNERGVAAMKPDYIGKGSCIYSTEGLPIAIPRRAA